MIAVRPLSPSVEARLARESGVDGEEELRLAGTPAPSAAQSAAAEIAFMAGLNLDLLDLLDRLPLRLQGHADDLIEGHRDMLGLAAVIRGEVSPVRTLTTMEIPTVASGRPTPVGEPLQPAAVAARLRVFRQRLTAIETLARRVRSQCDDTGVMFGTNASNAAAYIVGSVQTCRVGLAALRSLALTLRPEPSKTPCGHKGVA